VVVVEEKIESSLRKHSQRQSSTHQFDSTGGNRDPQRLEPEHSFDSQDWQQQEQQEQQQHGIEITASLEFKQKPSLSFHSFNKLLQSSTATN